MNEDEDFIITSRELVEVGYCFSGQKEFFASYGIDAREVAKDGILASRLLATEDGHGIRAVKLVKERRNGR